MTRDSCVIRFQKRRSLPKEISHKCAISLHHSIHFSSMQSSSAYPAPRGSSGFTASGDKAQWQCDPKWESGVCIYLDNSNIFIEAQRLAVTRNGNSIDLSVRRRIRVDFENLVALCCANRKLVSALAAGSIPPELRNLWSRLEAATGAQVSLFNRGDKEGKEQQVPEMDACERLVWRWWSLGTEQNMSQGKVFFQHSRTSSTKDGKLKRCHGGTASTGRC